MTRPNGKTVLERIAAGHEVWGYVDHMPPRPYANFFLDFGAMEHRMLFWQLWSLGLKGLHYWCVNATPLNCDPFKSQLDLTPVNGNGRLLYAGKEGPLNSIRWEVIRDGIEDYDYLVLFLHHLKQLQRQGNQPALVAEAEKLYDFKALAPDLVNYTRDPDALLQKRAELGVMIARMNQVLR